MMKLYWAPRTRASSAIWMLEEAGQPYERVKVDLGAKTPEFLAVNAMGKVPALRDDDATMGEAAAICAYVADRFPDAKLAPTMNDPRRGKYLQWLFFAPGCMEPALVQLATKLEMPPVAAGWGTATQVFDVLDKALEKGPWLLGDDFSAADVAVGNGLNYAINIFKMVPMRPSFERYLERCAARPAFQRAREIAAGD